MMLMIGLRSQVGADWDTYKRIFNMIAYRDLWEALTLGDPGYQLLNWLSQQIGSGVWLVNLVCGILFTWGLIRFAQAQDDPWLTVLVGIPYLVIVVAMGYTRQAVAIGFIMAGFATLKRTGSLTRFLIYAMMAAMFHKTAVLTVPFVIFTSDRNRTLTVLAGLAAAYALYSLFLTGAQDRLLRNYESANSQGAAIRVAMDILPAALFLLRQRAFGFVEQERKLWRNLSLAALGCVPLLFILKGSTAVDRMALYLIPIQLVILPRLGNVYLSQTAARLLVIIYSLAIQFSWLNYATFSNYWVPYHFYFNN